jgi:hypothetical protein
MTEIKGMSYLLVESYPDKKGIKPAKKSGFKLSKLFKTIQLVPFVIILRILKVSTVLKV